MIYNKFIFSKPKISNMFLFYTTLIALWEFTNGIPIMKNSSSQSLRSITNNTKGLITKRINIQSAVSESSGKGYFGRVPSTMNAANQFNNNLNKRYFGNYRPMYPLMKNERGSSRDFMSEVIDHSVHSSHSHRPDRWMDFYNNGASWDHYMSPQLHHHSQMSVHDPHYDAHLTFQDNTGDSQRIAQHQSNHVESYPGEIVSGENSLSKFVAPPVFDGPGDPSGNVPTSEGNSRDHITEETKKLINAPESVATEAQNNRQLVDSLKSLMTPIKMSNAEQTDTNNAQARDLTQTNLEIEKVSSELNEEQKNSQNEADSEHNNYGSNDGLQHESASSRETLGRTSDDHQYRMDDYDNGRDRSYQFEHEEERGDEKGGFTDHHDEHDEHDYPEHADFKDNDNDFHSENNDFYKHNDDIENFHGGRNDEPDDFDDSHHRHHSEREFSSFRNSADSDNRDNLDNRDSRDSRDDQDNYGNGDNFGSFRNHQSFDDENEPSHHDEPIREFMSNRDNHDEPPRDFMSNRDDHDEPPRDFTSNKNNVDSNFNSDLKHENTFDGEHSSMEPSSDEPGPGQLKPIEMVQDNSGKLKPIRDKNDIHSQHSFSKDVTTHESGSISHGATLAQKKSENVGHHLNSTLNRL